MGGYIKKLKFTESQNLDILREAEDSVAIAELLSIHGISTATFYKLSSKYEGIIIEEFITSKNVWSENPRAGQSDIV